MVATAYSDLNPVYNCLAHLIGIRARPRTSAMIAICHACGAEAVLHSCGGAGAYATEILAGAKRGDLTTEQTSKFGEIATHLPDCRRRGQAWRVWIAVGR